MMGITVLAVIGASPSPALLSEGFQVTMLGVIAVFAGLALLAVLLPVIRKSAEAGGPVPVLRKAAPEPSKSLTPEEVAAVAVAIHTHLCRLDQECERKITWQDHEKPYSPWRLAGRAKTLLARTSLRLRDRRV